MSTRVVNCTLSEPYDVYVGRPSKWGNPWAYKDHTSAMYRVDTREEAVEKFKKYFMERPEMIEAARKELYGKVLGCWCKRPNIWIPCHGDVIANIIDALGPLEE